MTCKIFADRPVTGQKLIMTRGGTGVVSTTETHLGALARHTCVVNGVRQLSKKAIRIPRPLFESPRPKSGRHSGNLAGAECCSRAIWPIRHGVCILRNLIQTVHVADVYRLD